MGTQRYQILILKPVSVTYLKKGYLQMRLRILRISVLHGIVSHQNSDVEVLIPVS